MSYNTQRKTRWFFGGVGGSFSIFFTHPLDLAKVLLQTHQGSKISLPQMLQKVVADGGAIALYNGVSAALLRQLTYSTTRFGIYECGRQYVSTETFREKVGLASFAGWIGGLTGSPADLVNVRMQNDVKLPPEMRRNYKHAVNGIVRVYSEEGFKRLFAGCLVAAMRGLLMTVGQIAFYEEIKTYLLSTSCFTDNVKTHVTASAAAGGIATTLTQPLDVVKTRFMNAKPGEFSGYWAVIKNTGKGGPLAFYKGFVPAFTRVGPGTVLTFVFIEQLRLYVGYLPRELQNEN